MENKEVKPFGFKDKFGYMLGDFGCNMSFVFINSYMMLFYVTCLGIPGKIYSALIIIAKIWDAINDPIIGGICDSSHPKGNSKFMPWIKWASLPLLICSVIMFIYIPSAPLWAKCLLCLGSYMIWSIAYTSVNVPYGSLQSVITTDPIQRAELSNARSIGAMLAQAPVMVFLPLIVYDDNNNPKGNIFIYVVLVMGVIGFIAFFFLRRLVTERVKPEINKAQKFNYAKTFGAFLKNKPMLGVTISTISMLAFLMTATSTMQYIFMCYFKNAKLTSVGTVIAMVPMLLAMVLLKPLIKKFSKRQLCTYPFILSIIATAVITFVKIENPYIWLIIVAVAMFAVGLYTVLTWAMVADCIDYQEKRTGRREEGSIYATYSLFRKLAQGIGQAVVALAIDLTGYVAANGAEQTPDVVGKIYTMTGALPLIGSIICFVSMLMLYKFDNDGGKTVEKNN
ncbi:MAG: MFS transporter [Eubacterium sp.]